MPDIEEQILAITGEATDKRELRNRVLNVLLDSPVGRLKLGDSFLKLSIRAVDKMAQVAHNHEYLAQEEQIWGDVASLVADCRLLLNAATLAELNHAVYVNPQAFVTNAAAQIPDHLKPVSDGVPADVWDILSGVS